MSRALVLVASLAAAQVHAQAPFALPLDAPPGTSNTVLTIRAVGVAKAVVIEINGIRAAELKGDESFTRVYSTGRLQIGFGGPALESYAVPNDELVYELKDDSAKPMLVLKERKSIVAGYKPPPPPPAEIKSQAVATSDLLGAQKQAVAKRADPGAWRELGRHYLAAGETAKASRAYKEALRLQPGDAATIEVLEKIERK